jgi:uncharacterized protein YndB with AHSA1/START domain
MTQQIEQTILIKAPVLMVWDTLTNPDLMKQWMGEPEMQIEVITDWQTGSPIIIKGFHHIQFENKGRILQFKPGAVLQYDYISSISRLADLPENYTNIEFVLSPLEQETAVTLTLSNFPTEAIFRHVNFYWRTTIHIMKKLAEGRVVNNQY